jgi:dTDP-4-dehydrorhamnose 3,5-epimerase
MPNYNKIDTGRFVVHNTEIQGLLVIKQKPFIDHRGEFTRMYCQDEFKSAGLNKPIVQINKSRTLMPGSIRGIHYQSNTSAEDKIISCAIGKVFDVAVDIRPDSETYLRWFGIELSAKNNISLLIPVGFAHGFQSLEANSEIIYFVTKEYDGNAENGLNPLDPEIGIKWPLACTDISDKDALRPFINTRTNEKN